ncbi:MAG: glycosyltransferase [Bifidobacterium mongoliense]|nr:glycosyltransferase [Bifidobacterium mongoliense]
MPNASSAPRHGRVLLATAGSRGDVEPFFGLAAVLQEAGHEVRVAAPDDPIPGEGIDVASLGVSFRRLTSMTQESRNGLRAFREQIRPAMSIMLARVVDTAMSWQPDIIVFHPKLLTVPVVAERLGIPALDVGFTPVLSPTREFPAPGVASRSLGAVGNRLSYRAVTLGERLFAADIRAARRRLGLPSSRRVASPAGSLIAVSPTLLPRPADWPSTTHLTGDWPAPPAPSALSPAVREFLSDPAPFVYAGFGSMHGGDAVSRAEAIVESVRAAGLRLLLATGWGGLEPPHRCLRPDVLIAESVPHEHVLGAATVAIHHGGAGTVHATARAGTPSIIVPFLADQPFWARRLQHAGLTGPALHRNHLTPDRVKGAIADAVDRTPQAQAVAEAMLREDGPAAATALIAQTLTSVHTS